MPAPRTSRRMATRSRLWMFAGVETPAANSSRSQMSRAMAMMLSSGLRSNRSATAKSRCGVGHTRDSINGPRRRNFRRIWRRSFRWPPRTPGLDYPSENNIGMTYDVQWFTFTSGRTPTEQSFRRSKILAHKISGGIQEAPRF